MHEDGKFQHGKIWYAYGKTCYLPYRRLWFYLIDYQPA